MVLESNGHGVIEWRLWFQKVTVMVRERNGYRAGSTDAQGQVSVFESEGHGIID
jgi:hypothetical protein